MIFGATKRPTREQLEADAADVIAARVALGRPPPDVWEQAAKWRAAHPATPGNWYEPEDPHAAARSLAGDADLTVKAVRLPLAPVIGASPELRTRPLDVVAQEPAERS